MKDLASTKLDTTTGEVKSTGREKKPELEEVERLTDLSKIEGTLTSISDSSSIKAISPRNFRDQIQVEDTGSTRRLWIYVMGSGWYSTTLD